MRWLLMMPLAGLAVSFGLAVGPLRDTPTGTPVARETLPLPPAPAAREAPPLPPPALRQRGVSLGLFAEDVGFSYGPLLREIAALGATHVSLVVPLYQEHGGSTVLALHTRLSPSLSALADAIRAARRVGLEVMVFPIVRLARPRGPQDWRGTLAPSNPDAWWRSYGERMGELAALSTMTGASRLCVGSELSSLDGDVARWTKLLSQIRALFTGTLVYSANWDHYRDAPLLDLVDEAGVTAYFNLRETKDPVALPALEARWRALRGELETWQRARAQGRGRPPQPLVFTEVGYRSRVGASAEPWNEGSGGEPGAEEQRLAWEAFRRAWTGADTLAGFYVWNWYGWGGNRSLSYSPRGKPAADEVRKLLAE